MKCVENGMKCIPEGINDLESGFYFSFVSAYYRCMVRICCILNVKS